MVQRCANLETNDWRAKAANQTRLVFGQALLEVAACDPKAVVLSADTQDLLGMRLVGMPDAFAVVGPTVPLRAKYGMSPEAIVMACRSLLSMA